LWQFETYAVEGHDFSRAERAAMESGFGPGPPRLQPSSMALVSPG